MTAKRDMYANNLRYACDSRASIAQICRDIGLNRQQFNRYLSGQSRPSGHNGQKIARYFGIHEDLLDLPTDRFRAAFDGAGRLPIASHGHLLDDGFPGDLAELRNYLGYYESYHKSLSWPGMVVRSATFLREQGGRVYTKSIERMTDPAAGIRQMSKYVGQAAFWRNRVFFAEYHDHSYPFLSQAILLPFGEHQRSYLRGLSTGVAWRHENVPYTTRIILRAVGRTPDTRLLLQQCGLLPEESPAIPLPVRRYLNSETAPQFLTVPPD